MGHAGAIISGGKGTAEEKIKAMRLAGIEVVESPAEIGVTMKKALDKYIKRMREKQANQTKNKNAVKSSTQKNKNMNKPKKK
jgi:succinyl-CoA synthetase alpha subunit